MTASAELIAKAREFISHPNIHFHYKDGAEVMQGLVDALEALSTNTGEAGMVLVPREPTEAMIAAAKEAIPPATGKNGSFALLPRRIDTAIDGYRAMIDAALKAQP